jgi:hypothetical protein
MYKPRHFTLKELTCPHVFSKFGEVAWQFFDDKMLMTIDLIRDQLGPIYVNNWDFDKKMRDLTGMSLFDERGFRCIQCSLVKDAIAQNRLYVSPHMTGQGVDFDVKGMLASEVRKWLKENSLILPYPIRLENAVTWVHLDTRDAGKGKIYTFNN